MNPQDRKRHILVADDDEIIRTLTVEVLQSDGWDVSAAKDGEEALAMIRKRPPDLIILDNKMPGLSGLEILRRNQSEGIEIPVILISASGHEIHDFDEKESVTTLRKPFGIDELSKEVFRVMRKDSH